jgi:hypothetical protein
VLSIWFSLAAAVVPIKGRLQPEEEEEVVLVGCEPRHLFLSQPGPHTQLLLAAVEAAVLKETVLFFLQSHRLVVVLAVLVAVAVADQAVALDLAVAAVALPEKVTAEDLAPELADQAEAALEVVGRAITASMAAAVDLGLRLQLQEVPILTPVAAVAWAESPPAALEDLGEVAAVAMPGQQAMRKVVPLKQAAEVADLPLEAQVAPVDQALL